MRTILWIACIIASYCLSLQAAWGGMVATHFQLTPRQEGGAFILDLSGKTEYKVFLVNNPDRLVIDLKDTVWGIASSVTYKPTAPSPLIKQIRHGIQEGKHCRIVLDLSQTVKIAGTELRPLNAGSAYRLEVSINVPSTRAAPAAVPASQKITTTAKTPPLNNIVTSQTPAKAKLPVIVIDPGHGGDDPGTLGQVMGVYEKDITLTYALALKTALEKKTGYKVVLTRSSDYFVPLGERVALAQRAHGDLFISLHANSHPKEIMSGLSVYTVSDTASDNEAEMLAAEENKEDVLKNINLSKDNAEMTPVLITLMQRETKNLSASFAECAINELGKNVQMLRNTHRFAGFKVLKGVNVPAVLFELGYLSNHNEEKLLTSPVHRQKIITAMVRAIDIHFNKKELEASR